MSTFEMNVHIIPTTHRSPALRTIMFTLLCLLLFPHPSYAGQPAVRPGIDVLKDRGFDILAGKRVGLITNPTGVDSRLNPTIDILFTAPGVKLVALFGPEHGVRGDYAAGDNVDTYTEGRTGLPVHSLYGKTRKPSPEMLKGIDILVYDIQDNGCRSYTYISTMGLAMEAAAAAKIPFVVLDRPNPLGGLRVEGGLVEKPFTSFVSQFPVPYVYGLTCGELAKLLNGEKMLAGGISCQLTVVPMSGWKRSMTFPETGLEWVPTSPHQPRDISAFYYVCSGILGELGVISEGVGYTLPFQVFAAEWIDAGAMAEKMNALRLPGVIFRPIIFKPFYGRSTGKTLKGVQVHLTDPARVNLMALQFEFLQAHHELYPDRNPFTLADASRLTMFDKVAGSDRVRQLFTIRMRYEDVKEYLEKETEGFRAKAGKYFLYK
jgi:uncharacterized protein YbbC (DUF1343 family)